MNNSEKVKKFLAEKGSNNDKRSKYINSLFTRTLVSIIVILVSMIFINLNEKNEELYRKYVFTESLAFSKFNNIYEKYLGRLIKDNNTNDQMVFNETIKYQEKSNFLNGVKLKVGINYLVPVIQSGIVVFNGEKEDYGSTLIIQGVDGTDIWYVGVNIADIKLYDYVEKGTLLGESIEDNIVLVVVKDGEYLNFEEYYNEI